MSHKSSFEDKMRSKLDSYEAPYDNKYWKSFTKAFPSILKTSFWQAWYLPYLFSLLLFTLGYWWFAPLEKRSSMDEGALTLQDTIYLKETIYVKDTLVIKDTLYVASYASASRSRGVDRKKSGRQTSTLLPANPQHNPIPAAASVVATASAPANSIGSNTKTSAINPNLAMASQGSLAPLAVGASVLPETINAEENRSAEIHADTSAAAFASAGEGETLGKTDTMAVTKEAAIGLEEANAFEDVAPDRNKVFLTAGPRTTLFLPFGSGDFDTYLGGFAGGQLALEAGDFALSIGIQYGVWHNEYDDYGSISADRLAQFPNYRPLAISNSELEIVTQHLLLPVELSWLFYERRKWFVRLSAGALGNYLFHETFLYNIGNNEYSGSTTAGRSALVLSHLSTGVGVTYQLNQQLEIQSQFNYYHSLRSMGVSGLNAGAMGVQLGINWLLMPR